MRVLALGGAGAVAKESTRDLAEFSDFDEIVIGEYNVEAAERLAAEIGDPRLKVMHFNADDYDNMLRVFPQFDVVMNGLPFKYDYPVNRACVEAGVAGCDLSSEDPQFALNDEAVRQGITFVPGCGATPGITNLMVRRAMELLDQVETADIYFAAFRCLAPAPGLLTTTLWEFDPDIAERPETYLRKRRVAADHAPVGRQARPLPRPDRRADGLFCAPRRILHPARVDPGPQARLGARLLPAPRHGVDGRVDARRAAVRHAGPDRRAGDDRL